MCCVLAGTTVMSDRRDRTSRRSLLTGATAVGTALLPINTGATQGSEQTLEIVSTENAQLYYEFVVRGEVERTQTSDSIIAGRVNDAIISGNNPDIQVVRGYTGNPGQGDAYTINGDIIFFAQTGGTSDFYIRLNGNRIPVNELTNETDPTTPGLTTYIERSINSTLGIKTPGQGELYYELVVDGQVEGDSINDAVAAEHGTNDAITTDTSGMKVIRGFTGNPGYGDAYAVNGEVISFRRDGGSADFVFLLNGNELTLEELADTGTGFPTDAVQDPMSACQSAMNELDSLGQNPGEPSAQAWYNQVHGQMQRARRAIDTLVDEGYRFQPTVDQDLTIEIYEPATTSPSNQAIRPLSLNQDQTSIIRRNSALPVFTLTVSSMVMTKYAALFGLVPLGAITTAPYAANAISYLGGMFPTATQAASNLYFSNPVLFLLLASTMHDQYIRQQMLCQLANNIGSLLIDNPDLRATAQVIADRAGGCSVGPSEIVDYSKDKFLTEEPSEPEPGPVEVRESVICGGIENEWHVEGHSHNHSHRYQDERYTFSRTDDNRVYAWVDMENVPGGSYSFRWIRPSGSEHTTPLTVPGPDNGEVWDTRAIWSYIDLGPLVETGQWQSELYLGYERLANQSFTVTE